MKKKGDEPAKPMNLLQATGDPMAVAKLAIHRERIKNEVKHLVKNRTDDFVQNPMKRKLHDFDLFTVDLFTIFSWIHLTKTDQHGPFSAYWTQIIPKAQHLQRSPVWLYQSW